MCQPASGLLGAEESWRPLQLLQSLFTTLSRFATVGEMDPFADTKRSALWRGPYPLFLVWLTPSD